ncbi:TonB-dependent receptor [Bacteroides muris (ex Fokt et al. 2023)]|uniref:TonB-dependent receptor n=1 Tax=Bacteroides muris (ex Fokt et al. 2023) TaxID=2937417 RepID=A0A9X2NM56_9BACE|nr:TonB-dependent receptor [Bacteroides muris (ex Fokt et al. 2023)]MCR6503288.1 TonB-dependent receptor [Bacteroides muris (ex Fokt et al. 2023)]
MKKITYILAGVTLAVLSLEAQAQTQPQDTTMNRTVVVEQEYNPDIMDASKVNVLPKVEPPTVSKKAVEYDATLMLATQIPAGIMQAYTGKETQTKAQPGYARLGYGNYGNLDIRANYLFSLSSKDRLNLTFGMDGMDGKLDLPSNGGKWNSFYYRTHAGLDYVHAFDKVDMNITGKFNQSNFNSLPGSIAGKQKFVSGDVHLGVSSTSEDMPLRFRAETNLLLYQRQHDLMVSNIKENIVRTKADVTGSISDEQTIGMAFAMNNIFYGDERLENHTSADFNPYYLFQNDDWRIRLGAHVDLAFGFGKQFRAAPDVDIQYIFSDSYILYAQGKGGRLQNDFRRLETITPYGITNQQPDDTYEQLNAAIGFKASPVSGLWFNLYGGYQDLKNDLIDTPTVKNDGISNVLLEEDTKNFYAGADLSYNYKDIFYLAANAVYRHWTTDTDGPDVIVSFKPAIEGNLDLKVRPISPLLVGIGYRHIARQGVEESKADPVSNLYLSGSYELFKGISVYAHVNNLLNKNYQYYWGCPSEGLNFLGGVSFRF